MDNKLSDELKVYQFVKAVEEYIYSNMSVDPRMGYLNGGYAVARIDGQDSNNFYIDVHWGVLNDTEREETAERYAASKELVLLDILPSERARTVGNVLIYMPEDREA